MDKIMNFWDCRVWMGNLTRAKQSCLRMMKDPHCPRLIEGIGGKPRVPSIAKQPKQARRTRQGAMLQRLNSNS